MSKYEFPSGLIVKRTDQACTKPAMAVTVQTATRMMGIARRESSDSIHWDCGKDLEDCFCLNINCTLILTVLGELARLGLICIRGSNQVTALPIRTPERSGMRAPILAYFPSSSQLGNRCTQSNAAIFAALNSCRCSRRVPDSYQEKVAIDGPRHPNAKASTQRVSRGDASERRTESDQMAGRAPDEGGEPWHRARTGP